MPKAAKKSAPKPARGKAPPAKKAPVRNGASKSVASKKPSGRGGPSIDWKGHYASGDYSRWDLPHPSQELVGVTAALGLVPGSVALDVGCGGGTEAVFLAQNGFRTIGVDVVPEALALAAERAKNANVEIELVEASALSLPLEGDSVDFVNDRGLLHHLGEGDRARYAREMARVLKPGGVLVVRGARETVDNFVAITEDSLEKHFDRRYFRFGPILPIELALDEGTLAANMVMLRRTADVFGTY